MHVPWGIIKQRPHFFAEELSSIYHLDVLHRCQHFNKSHLVTKEESSKGNISFYQYDILPFDKIPVVRKLVPDFINRFIIKKRMPKGKKYDIVWITSPYTYWYFKDIIPQGIPLFYDCMDDMSEFPELSLARKELVLKAEKLLLRRTTHVIFSADHLKDKIKERYGFNGSSSVVNNAIEMPSKDFNYTPSQDVKEKIDFIQSLSSPIIYIGAIAPWFDFESVTKVLNSNKTVNLVLIGPKSVEIPDNPRIHAIGTVPRDAIFTFMQLATALIMPFKITELIKSVNPVKLYEYIYSGKPVIASRYTETEKFLPYVSLYSNSEELGKLIENSLSDNYPVFTKEEREAFLSNNTWRSRLTKIDEVLAQYI